MFFIVWGHLSPIYLNDFIYAFNVPLFFMISGYLFKPVCWGEFIKKNLKGLIIPYFLLGFSVILFYAIVKLYFGGYDVYYFPFSLFALLAGFQKGIDSGVGSQALWFVYTLFLIKTLVNVIRKKSWIHLLITIVMIYLSCMFVDRDYYSSFVNLFVSYPFFFIGYFLRYKFEDSIQNLSDTIGINRWSVVSIFSLIVFTYLISIYNGMPHMFNGKYGHSIVLFLLAGCLGTIALSLFCMIIAKKITFNLVLLYSKGSIIILAWQILFLFFINIFGQSFSQLHDDIVTFTLTIIIYILFIPVLSFVSKYCPILLGYRK